MYLWRAVDDEGEVFDVLVQKRRDKHAALKLLKRLLRNAGVRPEAIFTDTLSSYRANDESPASSETSSAWRDAGV
ncbi:DDE-type integrase/transposase/recombinase [Brevundimonas sp.]|uniref:DDE-type integrase/transposase/recombinase n=1 Tax=Brevundimonas sp. TaxID=1871086 RepID=UPI0025C5D8EF|nr:DDE-type integrase/transposase/recombinase [Brevundimonas sp.]